MKVFSYLLTFICIFLVPLSFAHADDTQLLPLNPDFEKDRIVWFDLEKKFGEVPPFKEGTRLGCLSKTLTNEFWRNVGKGYTLGAKKYSVMVSYMASANEEDPLGQLNLAQSMIKDGYNALLVSPMSDVNLQLAFDKAARANLPFINVSDAVIPMTRYFVGGVHYKNGVSIAKWFIEHFPNGGEVAMIEGQPLVYATTQRGQGFSDTINANPKFSLVSSVPGNWSEEQAYRQTLLIMEKYPNVIGIYAHNDNMAFGVVSALKKLNLQDKVKVFGTDGISRAYKMIASGELTGTVDSFPDVTGMVAVEVASRIFAGQKIPRVVETPQALITKDNVDKFLPRDIEKIIVELKQEYLKQKE